MQLTFSVEKSVCISSLKRIKLASMSKFLIYYIPRDVFQFRPRNLENIAFQNRRTIGIQCSVDIAVSMYFYYIYKYVCTSTNSYQQYLHNETGKTKHEISLNSRVHIASSYYNLDIAHQKANVIKWYIYLLIIEFQFHCANPNSDNMQSDGSIVHCLHSHYSAE